MRILLKIIIITFLMTLMQFNVSASVCTYIPIVMSYSNDFSIEGKNPPHRAPAYKKCPVKVSFDTETGILSLDNAKCPYSIEYDVYNEDGQLVEYGVCPAYTNNNVNLISLTEGQYQLKIKVGLSTFVGIIIIP